MLESLPGDSTEVDWGGSPELTSTEFVELALLMEEYPEVVMSLPSSLLLQRRDPGIGSVWVPGTRHPSSSGQGSSSLDSWQQCCSGFR